MLLVLASLLGTADAAGQVKPYMNGVGAAVNTIVFPQQFPQTFPGLKGEDSRLNMNEVQFDASIGLKGVSYINKDYRVTINPYFHKGFGDSGFRSLGLDFGIDKTLFKERNVMTYGGVNIGKGWMTFDQSEKGVLKTQQPYAQAQVGGIYFNRTSAYELALFARAGLGGLEEYTLGGVSYPDEDLKEGLYWIPLGLQFSYYYGDFRAIHSNGKKGKKKGKKGKK
jgi:hypothetical protein